MIKQTKERRDRHSSRKQQQKKQKSAGISHGEDWWIQTLEIDGARKQLSHPGMSVVNFVVKPLPGLISLAI